MAGLIVAIMLVPQSMAYAMVAGLPPQTGLYASIVPLVLYGLFGSSNSLSVGPVAMVSLLVFSGVSELAEPGSDPFIAFCLTLALMVGVLQLLMAMFRAGFLVNFISHPVLVGFTSASALVIGFSQFKHFFGVSVERSAFPLKTIFLSLFSISETNPATLIVGLVGIGILLFFGNVLEKMLQWLGMNHVTASTIARTGPLVAVVSAAIIVYRYGLADSHKVAIVGAIPAGLPWITWPSFQLNVIARLLPLALVITLVGYLESISVAKALASRKREKIDPDRELLALGLADIGAAFTGGYPVTGGFSRSLVNFSAGVRTPAGSLITAGLVAFSVAFLTPWFFYIPKAVLAAIIIVAVVPLVDFKTPFELWKYSRSDAIALIVTFVSVLALGIETGIGVGVVATVVMMMWRMSRPHVAEVGRVGDSEHFRSVSRHHVKTIDGVFAFRVDESLTFANAPFLESYILDRVSNDSNVQSVLLISTGINDIDSTGVEVLWTIRRELSDLGIGFFMSDVKGPVTDKLEIAGLKGDFIFLSADQAMKTLDRKKEDTDTPVTE